MKAASGGSSLGEGGPIRGLVRNRSDSGSGNEEQQKAKMVGVVDVCAFQVRTIGVEITKIPPPTVASAIIDQVGNAYKITQLRDRLKLNVQKI